MQGGSRCSLLAFSAVMWTHAVAVLAVPEALPWSQQHGFQDQVQDHPSPPPPFAGHAGHHLPHTCDLCGKGFRIRDSLYKHRNVHRGNTTCPICRAVLNRSGYLKRHLASVHGLGDGAVWPGRQTGGPSTDPQQKK